MIHRYKVIQPRVFILLVQVKVIIDRDYEIANCRFGPWCFKGCMRTEEPLKRKLTLSMVNVCTCQYLIRILLSPDQLIGIGEKVWKITIKCNEGIECYSNQGNTPPPELPV